MKPASRSRPDAHTQPIDRRTTAEKAGVLACRTGRTVVGLIIRSTFASWLVLDPELLRVVQPAPAL
ncbi:MAG: hypothetical protein V3W24_05765, partial [Gemmatimonadota bacterium]